MTAGGYTCSSAKHCAVCEPFLWLPMLATKCMRCHATKSIYAPLHNYTSMELTFVFHHTNFTTVLVARACAPALVRPCQPFTSPTHSSSPRGPPCYFKLKYTLLCACSPASSLSFLWFSHAEPRYQLDRRPEFWRNHRTGQT